MFGWVSSLCFIFGWPSLEKSEKRWYAMFPVDSTDLNLEVLSTRHRVSLPFVEFSFESHLTLQWPLWPLARWRYFIELTPFLPPCTNLLRTDSTHDNPPPPSLRAVSAAAAWLNLDRAIFWMSSKICVGRVSSPCGCDLCVWIFLLYF